MEKLSFNKNLILKGVLFSFIFAVSFLFAPKLFNMNVSAGGYCNGTQFPYLCSGNPGQWCCEMGNGYMDYGTGSPPCTVGNQTNWNGYKAYKCISGGSSCGNGCYRCNGSNPPPPTPPQSNPPKNCGETGCNNADYPYCTSGNICNQNKCQVICGSGYNRSGDCGCVPNTPPLSCGQSGCNSYGCNNGNACNGNVCQVNCPGGHSRSGDCSCLPPCSNLSASFSQNSCSLDVTISGVSSYLRNLTFSGPAISTISTNSLYRHTITGAGTKAWTLSWYETASVGSGSRNCSTSISYNIPAPACGTVNSATSPNPLIWGNTMNLKAEFLPLQSLASTPQTYTVLSNVHSTLTSCSGNTFSTTGENCFLPWVATTPKTYPWSIQWQTASKTCAAVVNPTCSWSNNLQATNQPSYLKTNVSVSYIRTIDNQPAFNLADNFSSNIFGSNNPNTTAHVPLCTGTAINCTKTNYLLLGYSDSNSIVSPSTWYTYLKGALEKNANLNLINWAGARNLSAVVASGQLSGTKENVVEITGDFDATGVCTKATIFLVSANLNITPNLSIANQASDACLFIVNGSTRVFASSKVASTCGGTHIDNTTVANPRDDIQSFIITSNFTTNASAVQLYVKGGVITNTFVGGLNRKVNTDSCLYPYLPSEYIDYEGARYIKNFRTALSDPTVISIFENQYKSVTK